MKMILKDVTGEIYETPDVPKELILELMGGNERAAIEQYQTMLKVFDDFKTMTKITINVGSLDDERNLNFNPVNVVWIRIVNQITEWEDEKW